MIDRLARGVFPSTGLRAVFVRVTQTSRMARMLHGLYPTVAHLFSEGLAAGLLVASLQKDHARVNLQLACDGPARGFLVDADAEGNVRGYVRAPHVHFPGDPASGVRGALGRSGYLSVVRDLGQGQFYRGQIELRALDVARDLELYFTESEQIATAVGLAVVPRGDEPLGDVVGLLVQRLPGGQGATVDEIRERLAGGALYEAMTAGASAQDTIAAVGGAGFELLADLEVAYRCGCSLGRARAAVSALGLSGLREVLADEREAVVTCEFCRQRYVVPETELREMERRLVERGDVA